MDTATHNRRDFIGTAAALGLGAAVTSVAAVATAGAQEAGTVSQTDFEELNARVDRLASIAEIDNIIAQYSLSMDYCNPELGYDCAWPDAVFDYGGGDYVFDTKGFVDWSMETNVAIFAGSRHDMVETWHKIVGDKAVTETRAIVTVTRRNEAGDYQNTLLNSYLDYWERRDGVWKIAKRYLQCDAGWNTYPDSSVVVFNDGSGRPRGEDFKDSRLAELLALLDE